MSPLATPLAGDDGPTAPRLEVIQSSILFRHGDRSPSHNMFEPDTRKAAAEAFAWASELPSDSALAVLDNFAPARYMPRARHRGNGIDAPQGESSRTIRPRDAELGSFGRLSRVGLYQAMELGAWLQGFYSPPHNAAIRITSSNYARTIKTAQAVLQNFLPGDTPDGAVSIRVQDPADEYLNVYPFFPELQRRMALLTQEGWFQDFDKQVLHERRRLEQLFPTFAFHLRKFSWLACQDHFRCRELRQGKIDAQPRQDNSDEHGVKNGSGDDFEIPGRKGAGVGLGGVDWKDSWLFHESSENMKAAFQQFDRDGDGSLSKQEVFRAAEGLLPKSCLTPSDMKRLFDILDQTHDGKVSWEEFSKALGETGLPRLSSRDEEEELWALRPTVEEYTIKRFSMWYEDDDVREMATGGLMVALTRAQDNAIRRQSNRRRGRAAAAMQFNLMCGHDVTVLPLLHVVGAKREANKWPGYCCALIIELLRCPVEGEYYVRVLWHPGRTGVGDVDDSPECVALKLAQPGNGDSENGSTLLRLEDFRQLAEGPLQSSKIRQNASVDIPALV